MALTEIYVDPSIAADSGAGTSGDPYGDLEYAIEQSSLGAGGTRFNVKAGTDEVIATDLDAALATAGITPTETAQLVIQGYTATAGDGGIGGISGGGSTEIITTSRDYINLIDLHLHNTGSAIIVDLDNFSSVLNCQFDNTSGAGLSLNVRSYVGSCYFTNIGGAGLTMGEGLAEFNYFENGATNQFSTALSMSAQCVFFRNIFSLDGSSNGIATHDDGIALNNSIYSDGGTGRGIFASNSTIASKIANNLVEGFSGSGGVGIDLDGSNSGVKYYGANSAYNCATDFNTPTIGPFKDLGGNESLSESPFTNASTKDFSPKSVGMVKEGSQPQTFGNGII